MSSSGKEFAYVLQKQQPQRICFGSGRHRDTTGKDPNPFMRYYILQSNPNVAPNSYNALESFKAITTKPCSHSISKKGYSGIARFNEQSVPQDEEKTPMIISRDTSTIKSVKNDRAYSFGSRSERKLLFGDSNPGPGMYTVDVKKGSIQYEHSFGGKVKMKLGTELKCCSRNVDTCAICGRIPFGDYWQKFDKVYLCRSCMNTEILKQTSFNRRELDKFRKIRNCSHIHRHEGTDAKIWIMHPKNMAQWARREAYVSSSVSMGSVSLEEASRHFVPIQLLTVLWDNRRQVHDYRELHVKIHI